MIARNGNISDFMEIGSAGRVRPTGRGNNLPPAGN
jgi:hypothetical protein